LGWSNDDKGRDFKYCTDDWGDVLKKLRYNQSDDWKDSRLCGNMPISFTGSPVGGQFCTPITEPSSPGWPLTFVCIGISTPGSPGTPATPPSAPTNPACSNKGSQLIGGTCGGEIFIFSPALYMTNPAIQPPSDGATQYDSITSLPPVL
jgi:hypothetical protein